MTNEELEKEIQKLKNQVKNLSDIVNKGRYPGQFVFNVPVFFRKGFDFLTRQDAITKPTGGSTIDSQARTAIDSIIDELKNVNITN